MSGDLFAEHIPLMRPWLGEEEAQAVRDVILSGWVSLGPKVAEFEERLARKVGAKHAVATSSATTALHLALRVLGVGAGDEVVLPSFTCMANANAIIIAGARPVFADIDPRTYNLDPSDVERRIGPRTRAIMLVDQIGLPADLDAFKALAERRGLLLLEDAATALGGRYRGQMLGGHGLPTCFSFHPRKMITTGEGGMLVTDDAELAEQARILRSTGASVSDLKRHEAKGTILQEYHDYGYNYRLTDMQAAMGIVQLTKLDAMVTQRTEQAIRYGRLLADVEGVAPPEVPPYAQHAFSSYCIRLQAEGVVEAVVRGMAERNISCRRGIPPLHFEPYFRKEMRDVVLPASELASRQTMFLPIFPGLTSEQQTYVVTSLKGCLASLGA